MLPGNNITDTTHGLFGVNILRGTLEKLRAEIKDYLERLASNTCLACGSGGVACGPANLSPSDIGNNKKVQEDAKLKGKAGPKKTLKYRRRKVGLLLTPKQF